MKKRSLYYKMLLSLIVLGVVLVVCLSAAISVSSERNTARIVVDADRRMLEQIAFSTNHVDNSARVFAMALYTNSLTDRLFHDRDLSLWEAVNRVNSLRVQVNASSEIHSVYIYSSQSGRIYSTDRKMSQLLEDFFDTGMMEIIRSNTLENRLAPIPRVIPMSSSGTARTDTNVFTYVVPEYPFSDSSFPTALIVNLDSRFLMETIEQFSLEEQDLILILDREGRIIGHPDPEMFLSALPEEYGQVLTALEGREHGRFTIGGKDVLVTVMESPGSGWTFMKISPYRVIMDSVLDQRFLSLAIGIVFLALVFLLAVLFSNTLYKPVRTLVRHVEKLGRISVTDELNQDELKFVASAFSDAVERVKTLSAFRRNNLDALRSQYIKQLLDGTAEDEGAIRDRLSGLGSPLQDQSRFRLLLIRLDPVKTDRAGTILEDMMTGVLRNSFAVLSEMSLEIGRSEVVHRSSGDTVVIVGSSEPVPEETMKALHDECRNNLAVNFDGSVSSALSSGSEGLKSLSEQYREARDLIEYRIIFGPGAFIRIDDIEEQADDSTSFPLKEELKLIGAMKQGQQTECLKYYEGISETLSRCSYENIRLGYTRIASSIFDYLNTIEIFTSSGNPYRFTAFSRELAACPFLKDIDALFRNLLTSVCTMVRDSSGNKTVKNIEAVKEYMEREYRDPGLNLSMAASELKMSPVYLGRVFRQLTSRSFNAWLTDLRLKKAAVLLMESDMTVENVAGEVGITNTRFFFTKFKGEYGLTPSQYRKQSKRQD